MRNFFLILFVLFSTDAAHAELAPASTASTSSPFVLVRHLMVQQQWQAAQLALQDAAQDPAADPVETLFLGGLIAMGNQNYAGAIAQFQKILLHHPDIPRVRLELAHAFFLAGDDDAAQYHFERALAGNLPEAVTANVQDLLAQIRARRSWQFGLGFGISPDSNVNQATSAQTVTIGGLPFTLSSDARETGGVGTIWQLHGERRWQMTDQWRFTVSGNLLRKDYRKPQYNDLTLYSRIGPRYLFEDGDTGFGVSLSKRLLGDRPYNDAPGLFLDTNYRIGERWLASVSLETQQYRFAPGKGQPGSLTSMRSKLHYLFSPISLVEGGLDLARDGTISDAMRHHTLGVSAGYRSEAVPGLVCGVNMYAARSLYPEYQPFFNQHRNDFLASWTVDMTRRDWKILGFSPAISLTAIRNHSTVPLYSFRRTLGQLGINRQF